MGMGTGTDIDMSVGMGIDMGMGMGMGARAWGDPPFSFSSSSCAGQKKFYTYIKEMRFSAFYLPRGQK